MKIHFFLALVITFKVTTHVFGQDSIRTQDPKLDFLHEIEDRNWRIQIPVWVPGLTGEFAYATLSNLPEEGDMNIIGRLEGDIGVTFYLIGDFQYTPNKWLFAFNGFHTTLASDLKFQNIDKVTFPAAIEGTILRGITGYQVFRKKNSSNFFNAEIHPFVGFRYIDLNIFSKNSNILDVHPSWFEPLVGVRGSVSHKRWFFSGIVDVGGFSINNHWSKFASLEANYRFSKLFGVGLGWTYLSFNYNQEYDFRHLDLNIALTGPVLNIQFYF